MEYKECPRYEDALKELYYDCSCNEDDCDHYGEMGAELCQGCATWDEGVDRELRYGFHHIQCFYGYDCEKLGCPLCDPGYCEKCSSCSEVESCKLHKVIGSCGKCEECKDLDCKFNTNRKYREYWERHDQYWGDEYE